MAKGKGLEGRTFADHQMWRFLNNFEYGEFNDFIKRNGIYTFQSGNLIIEIQKGSGLIKTSLHKKHISMVNGPNDRVSLIAQPEEQYHFEGHLDEDVAIVKSNSGEGFIVPTQDRTIITYNNDEVIKYKRVRISDPDVVNPNLLNILSYNRIVHQSASRQDYPQLEGVLNGFLECLTDPELKLLYKSFLKK